MCMQECTLNRVGVIVIKPLGSEEHNSRDILHLSSNDDVLLERDNDACNGDFTEPVSKTRLNVITLEDDFVHQFVEV